MSAIIQLADLHFGAEDETALQIAAEVITETSPDAIIVCGDLTQRGKRSEFQAASDWLATLPAKTIIVPGNHDTPLLDMAARAIRPFERFETYFPGPDVLETPASNVIGLNTARGWQFRANWAEGSVDLEDLDRALSLLDTKGDTLNILTCHHPFLSPPDAPMVTRTRRGKRASQALAASNVDLLLTGHVHTPSVQPWHHEDGQYLAISCGTLSTRLRTAPPSFNIITARSGHIEIDAVTISGSTPETVRLFEFNLERSRQRDVA